MSEQILNYFPELKDEQIQQIESLYSLYEVWNSMINVISRKDFENFYVNHVLHSLSILKHFNFSEGTRILDVGTGGGFPGIPLAICLPHCEFVLNDSIGKKIKVAEDVADHLNLKNVRCIAERAENIREDFDFITGRAVTALPDFVKLIRNKISKNHCNAFPNGILYLKGGDFKEEMKAVCMNYKIYNLSELFKEKFFETKKLVYLF